MPTTRSCCPLLVLTIALLGLWASRAPAQPPGGSDSDPSTRARALSLEDAMSLAGTETEGVRAARAAARQANAEVRAAQASWWPQLSGFLTYQRTLASEYDDLFDAGMTNMGLGELPFGRDHTWRAGLSVNQVLWSFGRISSEVATARAARRRSEIAVSTAGATAQLRAAQAYYGSLLAEQLLEIADATLAQAQRTLEVTQVAFDLGTRPEFDVLRARVSRDNQRSVVVQRRSQRDLARVRLREATGLALGQRLLLTTPLESSELAAAARALSGESRDGADAPVRAGELATELAAARRGVKGRAPVREAAALLELQEAQRNRSRANRYPNLSLGSDLSVVDYPNDPWPDTDTDAWRTNWTVGVTLTVPIFTGFRITAQLEAAEAGVRQARARLNETRRAAIVDDVAAREHIDVARAIWAQSARTVAEARRAYEIARLQFDEGVSSQLDLVDARLLLDQARINRARAAHDLQLAELRLALLPNLPLTGAPDVRLEESRPKGSDFRSAPTGDDVPPVPDPTGGAFPGAKLP